MQTLEEVFSRTNTAIIKTVKKKKPKRKLAVIDFETDPFLYGRIPKPFCCEFYSDEYTEVFWGDNCAEQLVNFLQNLETPYIIYAHNGGKFDFHFLLKYISNPVLIIKTRITEARLFHHTLRDSYSILPIPLRDYDKMEFDYSRMERGIREQYKSQILEYLHSDCLYLFNLVDAFIKRFGPRMTIGGTAIKELKKLHPFITNGKQHDSIFRQFYYGGRVQVFQHGILEGPWKYVDVNSEYPSAMKYFKHPINGYFDYSDKMPGNFDNPFFITFRGRNRNALPSVTEEGELIFTKEEGLFKACSHEIKIALEHNLIEIDEVLECYISTLNLTFEEYVDKFYKEKSEAKANKDKATELFSKLLLNSAYGRMGINPENFADWVIHKDFGNEEELIKDGYSQAADYEDLELWSRPTEIKDEQFCDVAIAASITSAARSILLTGLQSADQPLYCDTDSIICRDFNGEIDKYKLGAWDLEKTGDIVAIAGKKMYALYQRNSLDCFRDNYLSSVAWKCAKCKLGFRLHSELAKHQGECNVKLSSKGGSLNLAEIVELARGATINFKNDAPTFSLRKSPTFITRTFNKTVD